MCTSIRFPNVFIITMRILAYTKFVWKFSIHTCKTFVSFKVYMAGVYHNKAPIYQKTLCVDRIMLSAI